MKKEILIICPFYPPNLGGVETHLKLLTEYLDKKGYLIYVLTYCPLVTKINYLSFEKKGNIIIRRYRWFRGNLFDKLTPHPVLQFLYIIPGLLFNSFFWMLRHHNKIQVIHAHGFAGSFISRIITLPFPKIKKVASIHFIYKKLSSNTVFGKIFKWIFIKFDKVLLTSSQSIKEFRSVGVPVNKLTLFRLWLTQENYQQKNKIKSKNDLNINKKYKMIILFIGRTLRMKGVFNLLEVAKLIPKDILIIALGGGPDEELLAWQSKGVENFLYKGRVSEEIKADCLGAADFLILPSISEETQPIVIMEALLSGRPVIVTNKGGAKELIDESVGIVIEPSVAKIKETILYYYNHPQKREYLEMNARNYGLKNFSEKNAQEIVEYYFRDK